MDSSRWIFWIVGIFVLLRLFPVLAMIPALLRMRLRPFSASPVDAARTDPQVVAWLREAAAPLAEVGFEEAGFAAVRDLMDATGEPETQLFLRHPETGTFAQISPAQIPDYRLPWRIDLDTPLHDGGHLTTLNALEHAVIGSPPGNVVHNVMCLTQEDLWNAHREQLRSLAEPEILGFEDFLHRSETQSRKLLDLLQEQSVVLPDGEERYRFRLGSALRLAWKMGTGNARRERFLNQRGKEIQAGRVRSQAVEPWQEVDAHLRAQRAMRNPVSPGALLAIFLVSGIAFAFALSWVFGVVGVLCLLGVIAFHEFGHYGAMRLFGYRDTSIFFVPFLGAATTGSKEDASLSEEMFVFLAGPVPGIALGVGLLWLWPDLLSSDWGSQLAVMLIAINVLNLLPVMPLDGGKVIERVLLAGRPWTALAVGVAGILVFAWLAVSAGDPVLLVFCALFALNLRSHFRAMRLLQRAKLKAASDHTERDRAEATFAALAEESPVGFARKVGLARLVEGHWIRVPDTRLGRACWFAAYGAVLVGSVAFSAVALSGGFARVDLETTRTQWLDPAGAQPVSCEDPTAPPSLSAIGGDDYWRSRLLLVCEADNGTVQSVNDELTQFVSLDEYVFCLLPPWEVAALSADKRERISRNRTAFLNLSEKDARFTANSEQGGAHERVQFVREAWSGDLSANGDPELLDLYVRLYVEGDDDDDLYQDITELLGHSERRCPLGTGVNPVLESILAHEVDQDRLRIALQLSEPEETFDAVVGYLCSAGCRVQQQSGRIQP